MSVRTFLLAGVALSLLTSVAFESAKATVASGGAWGTYSAAASTATLGAAPVLHRRRSYSYYCYRRNYWWFYRPYTTAQQDHARCMPYFHYPPRGYSKRGSRYDRGIK